MRNKLFLSLLAFIIVGLQGCAVAGGIFKAGTATGIILVVLVIAVIVFILAKIFGGKK